MAVRDDRGRRIRVAHDATAASAAARARVQRALRQYQSLRLPRRSAQIVMLILLILGVGLVMSAFGLNPAYAEFVAVAFLVVVSIGISLNVRRRHLDAAMRAAGICPACGYELKGLPMESKGFTLCPECGGAWRLEHTES
jgi:hypothetical protein